MVSILKCFKMHVYKNHGKFFLRKYTHINYKKNKIIRVKYQSVLLKLFLKATQSWSSRGFTRKRGGTSSLWPYFGGYSYSLFRFLLGFLLLFQKIIAHYLARQENLVRTFRFGWNLFLLFSCNLWFIIIFLSIK